MLDFNDLELTGPSVCLKPLTLDHAALLAEASSESRNTYSYNSVPQGVEGAKLYIERALSQRKHGLRFPFAIYWNNRVVGTTSYSDYQPWSWQKGNALQRTAAPDVVEIGYTWLAASAQRTGCNSETKFLLLQHAFESWEVHRVAFRTDERNTRSRQAIERLGAQFEGIRRGARPGQDGTVRNSAFYSITISEWKGVKECLAPQQVDT